MKFLKWFFCLLLLIGLSFPIVQFDLQEKVPILTESASNIFKSMLDADASSRRRRVLYMQRRRRIGGAAPPAGITIEASVESGGSKDTDSTASLTVGAESNKAIVVAIAWYDDGSVPTCTVAWTPGSTSITNIVEDQYGPDGFGGYTGATLWYIINPSAGTDTVDVDCEADTYVTIFASFLSGATQSNPTATCEDNGVNQQAQTCDATASNATDYTFDAMSTYYEPAEGANQVLIYTEQNETDSYNHWGGMSYETGTGTRTMSWTWSTNSENGLVAMVVEAG